MTRQALSPVVIRENSDGSVFITTNLIHQHKEDWLYILWIIQLTALCIYLFIQDYIGWISPFVLNIISIFLFIYNRWFAIEPYLSIDEYSIRYANDKTENKSHFIPLQNIVGVNSEQRETTLFLFFPKITHYADIIVDDGKGTRRTVFKFSNRHQVNRECDEICSLINDRLCFYKHHG